MPPRRNDEKRRLWVLNDEGLYNWWQSENIGITRFIRQNRAKIDEVIDKVESGTKPAHYLAISSMGDNMSQKIKVYVALVNHRHGTDVFCGSTEAEQLFKLANWCREWWCDTELNEPPPEDDNTCVDQYFEAMEGQEYVDFTEGTVTLPVAI